jgi:hypothetical protein
MLNDLWLWGLALVGGWLLLSALTIVCGFLLDKEE